MNARLTDCEASQIAWGFILGLVIIGALSGFF